MRTSNRTRNWRSLVGAILVAGALGACDKAGGTMPAGAASTVAPLAPPPIANAAPSASAPGATASARGELVVVGTRVDVVVDHTGFAPSTVKVKKGEPTTLVFTRTVKDTCADAVVFPELKIDKMLPLNKPVPVQVPVDHEHTYAFQCGMGMYKSKVVVQ